MKQYFAKFLPVEGEIKEGEPAFYGENLWIHKPELKTDNAKLAKLFLCSGDIQIGDKCWHKHPNNSLPPSFPHDIEDLEHAKDYKPYEVRTKQGFGPKESYFKVIGEISSDAKWVKEGDEFDKEQLLWSIRDEYGDQQDIVDWEALEEPSQDDRILIKGPCGHFH